MFADDYEDVPKVDNTNLVKVGKKESGKADDECSQTLC